MTAPIVPPGAVPPGAAPAVAPGALPGGTRGQNLRGILLFVMAVFCFAVMDTLIKYVSGSYGTWQIMFFRAFFALAPLAVLIARSGGVAALRTARPQSHILRSLVGVVAVFCFFHAFGHMPLADVYAISFAAPLIITALSVPLLKEHVGWRRWTAVAVGFAGVLIMLRPGAGVIGWTALVALAGTVCYALNILYIRHLSRTETNAAIIFYFMTTLAVVSGIAMLPAWVTPSLPDLLLLAALGMVGGVAQILLTQAFRLGAPSLLAPFEYTGMIWATAFGFLVFGDVPDQAIWIGSAVVIASGLYILHLEAVAHRPTP